MLSERLIELGQLIWSFVKDSPNWWEVKAVGPIYNTCDALENINFFSKLPLHQRIHIIQAKEHIK